MYFVTVLNISCNIMNTVLKVKNRMVGSTLCHCSASGESIITKSFSHWDWSILSFSCLIFVLFSFWDSNWIYIKLRNNLPRIYYLFFPLPSIIVSLCFSLNHFYWIGFLKFIFNWRIIALQYSVGFCHATTWTSHKYKYMPSLLNLPLTLAAIHSSRLS